MVVPITKKATERIMEVIQGEVKFYASLNCKLLKRFCCKSDKEGTEWDLLVFGSKERFTLYTVSLTFDKGELLGECGRSSLTPEIVDFAKEWFTSDNATKSDIEAKGPAL